MEPFFVVYFIALFFCLSAIFLGYWFDVFDTKISNPYPLLFAVAIAPYFNVIVSFSILLAALCSLVIRLKQEKDKTSKRSTVTKEKEFLF